MRQEIAKILSNEEISKDIYKMEIECGLAQEAKPGQFIEITVPPFFLRRPISISEIKENTIVIIYKILGEGTKKMTEMSGDLDIFGPLGHGFEIENKDHVVLVGGGVGVPPLFQTAKEYLKNGTNVDVVLGFNDKETIFYEEEFKALGCHVYIATMDGSYGSKGTVINAIEDNQIKTDFVCSCGPLPMLKAVQNTFEAGYISLEARMACGMGACMGCVVKDQEGHSLRVCKDGPVFPIGKVVL
ncbi:MAG: dihydroorotate dehydrogenase electron transfer subunit [Firmicutes bacterium]|nr:dihydroorotate dehydrogenase electron transfer subunit [Bacillota bacterium]